MNILQYLVKPVCMCCVHAWHIAPTFCLKPIKNIVTDWARRCWWLPICVVQFFYDFFFYVLLFLIFLSCILPAIHPHTINQVNGYLNSAWLHRSQWWRWIASVEMKSGRENIGESLNTERSRLKRICKNVHIKPGVHLNCSILL